MAMATPISPWKYLLYPELRKFEPDRQADALRRCYLNFVVAIPVLLVRVGPFHVRRVRRSLAAQLAKAHESESKGE